MFSIETGSLYDWTKMRFYCAEAAPKKLRREGHAHSLYGCAHNA